MPRCGSRSAAGRSRSAAGFLRAPAFAGRPIRSGGCLPPPMPGLSRRSVSWLPFVPLRSGGQQPLVLALLPLECALVAREPRVDGGAELGLAAQPRSEREVPDVDAEAAPKLCERP